MIIPLSWDQNLDFVALLASDFFQMNVPCDRPLLYKYLAFNDVSFRRSFLERPTFKFATKAQLNDPFDLSGRFDQFGGDLIRRFMKKYVAAQLEQRLGDLSFVIDEVAKTPEFKTSGLSRPQLRQLLETPAGKIAVADVRDRMHASLPQMIDGFFDIADGRLDEFIEGPISKTGILSLSEVPDNRALWSVYADGGNGFAFELDVQHPFFLARQRDGTERNRLIKVSYRDDRVPDIWTNPYYLFAVKHAEYAFEREWRLIRSLDDCDNRIIPSGHAIYTLPAPKGVITSIIFGHRWSAADVRTEGDIIRGFDPKISIRQAVPDAAAGTYSTEPVF